MKESSTRSKTEEWRPIPGFGGRYEVSDQGRVRSGDMRVGARGGKTSIRKGRVLKNAYGYFGYPKVTLANGEERKQIENHVLVLEAFVGPRPGKWPEVHARHKNGKPKDCRAENLEWGTAGDNVRDRERHGTVPKGEKHRTCRLTEKQAKQILASSKNGPWWARKLGVPANIIYALRAGKTWRHLPRGAGRGT